MVLFVLTYLTVRVPLSNFHREGELSQIATAITLFPLPIFVGIRGIYNIDELFVEEYAALLWIEFITGVLLPMVIMIVLFAPSVSTCTCGYVHVHVVMYM